ncbi:cellulase family glycosylhydrolase [Roseibaca sp. V10]|uniref:Cellulase family glycosylhydrolase n=1 Tax=Roseinatronobacter domitianus TaxID=2940293 RepID=A0ABT0M2L1_9RHOB|nr:cellulase family glycosylhydrolase [Roseibaca domitiana]MCL1628549.1 cellulase family glycosylhydrolase [Roseibaca domitiana]
MTTAPLPRWSKDRANAWWHAQPCPVGCNFLPSSAVNFLEMWMPDSFDRDTIARELRWAAEMGLNSIRTNLHYLVWKHDRDGLMARFDWLLQTASDMGLSVMPVLFDDCGFGGAEPVYGPQPDPVPGLHNSRAVASPGRAAVTNRALWPEFHAYLADIIQTHSTDPRILAWDLYNEPGNRMIFLPGGEYAEHDPALSQHSKDLMESAFAWARAINPHQPLTVAAWRTPIPGDDGAAFDDPIDRQALALSDVITFHAYCDIKNARQYVAQLQEHDRPIMITEWMARTIGSRIQDQLPLYHDMNVGAYNWGLVKGRTQTDQPWPRELEVLHGKVRAPELWFHDLLWPDGRAFDPQEVSIIRDLTQKPSRAESIRE